MKRIPVCIVVILFCFSMIFPACSKGGDSEKGQIEKMTDHTADVIVKTIRTPVDKARSAGAMEEERMRELDKKLKE